MKELVKRTLEQIGLVIHKKQFIPLGIDPFIDIQNHFGQVNPISFFDVGANTGQTIKKIKHRYPNSRIIAFEPISSTYQLLIENYNRIQNVILENLALGADDSSMEIGLAENSLWNSLKNMPHDDSELKNEVIEITTLDNYLLRNEIEHIDFLKIDVEGFEIEVLQGARLALTANKIDFVFCEVGIYKTDSHHTPYDTVADFLGDFGFKFITFYDHSLVDTDAHYANALFFNSNNLSFS